MALRFARSRNIAEHLDNIKAFGQHFNPTNSLEWESLIASPLHDSRNLDATSSEKSRTRDWNLTYTIDRMSQGLLSFCFKPSIASFRI
jgi:hypothetical protein